jgi:hypothetical protein
MKNVLLFVACVILVFRAEAQLNQLFYSEADSIAYRHIQVMKSNVIFVRLPTNHHSIEALKKQKRMKEAEYLRSKAENENKSVIKAFKSAFTFCEVHFFLAESSEDVKWRDFNGVFVDENLQVIQGAPIPEYDPFYVVDFGKVYFETFEESFEGVGVMDEYFIQLKKPFPFYVRKYSGIRVIERSNEDLVIELDKKLSSFYQESLKYFPAK